MGAATGMADGYFRVVAVDFDGTLTHGDRPDPSVLDAVTAARAAGLRVVLVTGRILTELRTVFGDAESYFDAIVAENGAVVRGPRGARMLAPPVHADLLPALTARGVSARAGEVLVACGAGDEPVVVQEIRRLGLECQLTRNRAELMVLPSGVTKGAGLLAALGELGLSRHNTIAVGDAENDHSLLTVAEIGVAVANAVPSLVELADLVLDEADGSGVRALLASDVIAGRTRIHPARWRLNLGVDDTGEPVQLPAAQINLLISGGTGSGKSYLTGLIAEQLIGLGYSLLVIDPEGDHVGLGELPGVLVVGGDRYLPPASAVVPLLHHRYATLILDLSHLDSAQQLRYLAGVPAEIAAHRRATGLPHWVIIDEAHLTVGRASSAFDIFDLSVKGYGLVTYQPERLSPYALAGIDAVLAMPGTHPGPTLIDVTASVADTPRTRVAELLTEPSGTATAVLAQRDTPRQLITIHLGPRTTGHFRHEHKYTATGLDTWHSFHFRTSPEQPTGATAANVGELEDELAHCDPRALRHHCPRHDLSRWVEDVFHDHQLATALRMIETRTTDTSPDAVVEAVRLDLIAALQARAPY